MEQMKKAKTYLQCGYEDKCKNKKCLKCPRRGRYNLSLTLAEQIVIENFAMTDLKMCLEEKPEEMVLEQDIMQNIMRKMFKAEKAKITSDGTSGLDYQLEKFGERFKNGNKI